MRRRRSARREIVEARARTGARQQGHQAEAARVEAGDAGREYKYVSAKYDRAGRYADLTMRGPGAGQPSTPEEIVELGDQYWPLRAYRELDDALLHLRLNEPEIGLVCLRTEGSADNVSMLDEMLIDHRDHWLVREIILHMGARPATPRSDGQELLRARQPGGCFAGNLLELLLASDRVYMLNDPARPVELAAGPMNAGALPMTNGLTRLESRFLAEPGRADEMLAHEGSFDAERPNSRSSPSRPTIWIGTMRFASRSRSARRSRPTRSRAWRRLRFAGPETMETKIYGRLRRGRTGFSSAPTPSASRER